MSTSRLTQKQSKVLYSLDSDMEDVFMKRIEIRNRESEKSVKPRVFDAIINDSGDVLLEIKNSRNLEIVSLIDVIQQIADAH